MGRLSSVFWRAFRLCLCGLFVSLTVIYTAAAHDSRREVFVVTLTPQLTMTTHLLLSWAVRCGWKTVCLLMPTLQKFCLQAGWVSACKPTLLQTAQMPCRHGILPCHTSMQPVALVSTTTLPTTSGIESECHMQVSVKIAMIYVKAFQAGQQTKMPHCCLLSGIERCAWITALSTFTCVHFLAAASEVRSGRIECCTRYGRVLSQLPRRCAADFLASLRRIWTCGHVAFALDEE